MEEYDRSSKKRTNEPWNRRNLHGLPTFDIDEERDDKPWQKILKQIRRKRSNFEPNKSVPNIMLLLVLGIYLSLGYLTQLIEEDMPNVVHEKDLRADNANIFSEETAKKYLYQMLGNAPRVSGTAFHYEKTKDLKFLLDFIAGQANLPVRTDWQFVSGDYWIEFTIPHVNCYQNLSNIVAVLEGESGFDSNGTIGTSLLVNCHYDSVPFAIGASDNGVFCAVMLETLSKLSKRKEKLKHNVIFLFNGAEENPLQGSHGFLQHPWSKGVTNVVNLDAAGMNGKPVLFQATDPRLLSAFQRVVPKPNAQAFSEYLFRTGLIPSDTDFRIWRDFGDIHGIDIAFAKWGNVYHTRNDRPELIQDGVIQNAGNLLLNLVKELADTEELKTKIPPTTMVYFDYLNLFLVSYTAPLSQIVDASVVVFALLTVAYYLWIVGFRRSSVMDLLSCVWSRILAAGVGIVAMIMLVLVLAATTKQLRYLSRPWLVVPLYWIPYFVVSLLTSLSHDSSNKKCGLSRSLRVVQAMAATRLLLAATLLILAIFPNQGSLRYIISLPLFITSTASLVSMTIVRYCRLKGWQHLALECALSVPSFMFYMTMSLRLNAIMLPTAGRSPVNYPDYLVGALNLILAIVVSTTVSGIELLFSRKRLWLPVGVIAAACVALMFVPLEIYENDGITTQRHSWFHTDIITYDINGTITNRTSGVLVTRQDAYTLSSVREVLGARGFRLRDQKDLEPNCQTRALCGLPLQRPRFAGYLHDSLLLEMEPPAQFVPEPRLSVNRSCNEHTCTLNCVMIGAPHNTLAFYPQPGVNLTGWSFSSPLRNTSSLAARPLYVVTHSAATYSKHLPLLEFTLYFNVTTQRTDALVEISHHAHKMQHPEDFTEKYRSLIEAMPKYFNIASALSIRSDYVF